MSSHPETQSTPSEFSEEHMRDVLRRQRSAQLADGPPDADLRIDRLDRAIGLVVDHQDEIIDALVRDFGHRSRDESLLSNVLASIEPLKFAKKNLRRWMRPEPSCHPSPPSPQRRLQRQAPDYPASKAH